MPMPPRNTPKSQSVILLIALALIWGTSFILMKKGLVVFSPGEVGSLRIVTAFLFLLPVALLKFRDVQRRHYPLLLAAGMMGIFVPAFLFAAAQTRLQSSVTGIMNSLTPICTLLIGVFFYGQKFQRQSIAGILTGLAGTVILMTADSVGQIGGLNRYALLVIIACLFYATYLNFVKYKITDLSAITITSMSLLLVGPLAAGYLFGFTRFTEKMSSAPGAWSALMYIVFLGVMSTSFATVLFNKLVRISSPVYTSSVTYLIPVVAVLWGLLDGERLFAAHFAGMAAIIGGVYLSNRKF